MKHALLLAALLLPGINAHARDYSLTQITHSEGYKEYTRLNNREDVLWISKIAVNDPGWTVFLYQSAHGGIKQISRNAAVFNSHQLNNRGDAVWAEFDGSDAEIYIYDAATGAVSQITDNDYPDSSPQLSDNGDIAWLARPPGGEALIMRFDAQTRLTQALNYPGATRQAFPAINARGDIVWNASVGGDQEVMLFEAASGAVRNLSDNATIDSNQYLMDDGDVLWSVYDPTTPGATLRYYQARKNKIISIAEHVGQFLATNGHALWTRYENDTYHIYSFDTQTQKTREIAVETSTRGPGIRGISARGDALWSTIEGADWISRYYNANEDTLIDLTRTQRYGAFDLVIAQNGDAVWSLWDGSDYEASTYQAASGLITPLSDNTLNDGITRINDRGTVLWSRYYPGANDLFLATKNALDVGIEIRGIELDTQEPALALQTHLNSSGIPDFLETITLRIDAYTVLNAPFSAFKPIGKQVYVYEREGIVLKLDFGKGRLMLESENIDVNRIDPNDGIFVEFRIAEARATDVFYLD